MLIAVVVGWLVALVVLESTYFIDAIRQRHALDLGLVFDSTIATGWFMAYFIIPVWFIVLIPLYLFIPLSSPLWRWPICMLCGAAAGFLIMAVFFLAVPGDGSWSYGAWAVLWYRRTCRWCDLSCWFVDTSVYSNRTT